MNKLPRGYISYNQIKVYQICPLKYFFEYIEKIERESNDKLILGSAFHKTLEEYLNKKIEGNKISEKELVTRFKTVFNELVNENKINWNDSKAQTIKKGLAFIHFFYNEVADTLNPLMVEKELNAIIPEVNIEIKGIIDIIEQDFSISDFKTSTTKWSNSRVQYSKLQTIIYKYLFEKNFEMSVSDLKFKVFYSKNGRNIRYQDIKVKTEINDFENMIKIIRYVAENIKQENFYKNESYACSFCDFKTLCKNYNLNGKKNTI